MWEQKKLCLPTGFCSMNWIYVVHTCCVNIAITTLIQEYQSTVQNSEVSQLVAHCEENSGTILKDLFMSIFQHVSVSIILCIHQCVYVRMYCVQRYCVLKKKQTHARFTEIALQICTYCMYLSMYVSPYAPT